MKQQLAEEDNGPPTWSSWDDVLGNRIYPGDLVAISTISGRSPQMVLARIERINRLNSKGEKILDRKWFEHPQPIQKFRRDGSPFMEKGEYREVPSCTYTCTPLKDARGFGRSNQTYNTALHKYVERDKPREVTYRIPQNVILVKSKIV